jgi:hypothetical protein
MARTATLVRPTRADAPPTDRDLIRRFAADKDEASFEALFRRHGPMVLAAARRVIGNSHDAEDVCQAAFLLLAKKAGTVKWRTSVAPWLHRTAHLMALKTRTPTAAGGLTPSRTLRKWSSGSSSPTPTSCPTTPPGRRGRVTTRPGHPRRDRRS